MGLQKNDASYRLVLKENGSGMSSMDTSHFPSPSRRSLVWRRDRRQTYLNTDSSPMHIESYQQQRNDDKGYNVEFYSCTLGSNH